MPLPTATILRRDCRGATLVEYIILVSAIALMALFGFRMFGGTIRGVTVKQAACVSSLDGGCGRSRSAPLTTSGSASPTGAVSTPSGARPTPRVASAAEDTGGKPLLLRDVERLATPLVVGAGMAYTGEVGYVVIGVPIALTAFSQSLMLGAQLSLVTFGIVGREVNKARPGIKAVLCSGRFAGAEECR